MFQRLGTILFTWLVLSGAAAAAPVVFHGGFGDLNATVSFEVANFNNLRVTLTNTSQVDVQVPSQVLTAVFFDIAGDPVLTRISAILAPGSAVLFGGTDPGGVVGGEWAYGAGLSGAPRGARQGISSVGLGLFGPPDLFPGTDLQNPLSPNGLQYGLTSAGDDPGTGNTPVTGKNALIQNSVVFTLGGLPEDFQLSGISHVSFQYGTDLSEPNVPTHTPEPGTLVLAAVGCVLLVTRRRTRPTQ